MTRKEFLKSSLAIAGALAGHGWISGCGDDGGGTGGAGGTGGTGGATGNCLANGTRNVIGANHGHVLTVSTADVAAGTDKTYDIQGSADHPHRVTVTMASFTRLQQNLSVTVTSTSDAGHSHQVTVSCA